MIRSDWLLAALAVLTVARLTHLITTDFIFDRPRAWLQRRSTTIAYLAQCAWCVSIWIGFAVAAPTYLWGGRWFVQIPLLALAASYITGLIEQLSALVNASRDLAVEQAEDIA